MYGASVCCPAGTKAGSRCAALPTGTCTGCAAHVNTCHTCAKHSCHAYACANRRASPAVTDVIRLSYLRHSMLLQDAYTRHSRQVASVIPYTVCSGNRIVNMHAHTTLHVCMTYQSISLLLLQVAPVAGRTGISCMTTPVSRGRKCMQKLQQGGTLFLQVLLLLQEQQASLAFDRRQKHSSSTDASYCICSDCLAILQLLSQQWSLLDICLHADLRCSLLQILMSPHATYTASCLYLRLPSVVAAACH